jgi:hypothetical protein
VVVATGGCATEGTAAEAEDALVTHLRGRPGYDTGQITCTGSPRLAPGESDLTLCLVRRREGGCDRFRVERVSGNRTRIRLDRRDASCIVPG